VSIVPAAFPAVGGSERRSLLFFRRLAAAAELRNGAPMWWQDHFSEFVTLLLVINPLAALPTFMTLTEPLGLEQGRRTALLAVLVAFVLLVFFVVIGNLVLKQIGIATRAFQIAGGIVLFLVALDMVHGRIIAVPGGKQDLNRSLAIYPLAFPIIAGPAAFTTVILLTDDDRYNFFGRLETVGVIAAVLAVQFVTLLVGGPISRALGSVVGRIMGMLLAALAVSMVLTAVGQWLKLPAL
jgi:multiple antibiotic resistance protein